MQGIAKDLEAMKVTGFGAALILKVGMGPGNQPWRKQAYRGEAWFDAVRHAAAEAVHLGMKIGLANAPGYTGTGGPWISEEMNMKRLVWTETPVEGPGKIDISLPRPASPEAGKTFGLPVKPSRTYGEVAVLAAPAARTISLGNVIDLTSRMQPDGRISWDVPEGKWSVYRIGISRR
jgi:hypothetical protein